LRRARNCDQEIFTGGDRGVPNMELEARNLDLKWDDIDFDFEGGAASGS